MYIGRGVISRGIPRSEWCNTFKVKDVGRSRAISLFARDFWDGDLVTGLQDLSAKRLVCHCRAEEACHGDVLVDAFKALFPAAYRLGDASATPSAQAMAAAAEACEAAPGSLVPQPLSHVSNTVWTPTPAVATLCICHSDGEGG